MRRGRERGEKGSFFAISSSTTTTIAMEADLNSQICDGRGRRGGKDRGNLPARPLLSNPRNKEKKREKEEMEEQTDPGFLTPTPTRIADRSNNEGSTTDFFSPLGEEGGERK